MKKIYKKGFYAGKFLPFHKGHKFCIKIAAQECEKLYVIFFSNSEEEKEILNGRTTVSKRYLDETKRINDIKNECKKYDNVEFHILDCFIMHKDALANGTDTWDAETPYVLNITGEFDIVYSSEPSYESYFKRAYPKSIHKLIDPPRVNVPISGTIIRNMNDSEADEWL